MKSNLIITTGFAFALLAGNITARAQDNPAAPGSGGTNNAPPPTQSDDGTPQPPADNAPATTSLQDPASNNPPPPAPAEATNAPVPVTFNLAPRKPSAATNAPPVPVPGKGLIFNFHGVRLETVLNYMSDAAGYIIHPYKVDLSAKVDMWSAQPLNREEALNLLKQVLNENGYTTIEDGRTLTIKNSRDAKGENIKVNSNSDPASVPKSSTEIVTQIIPVRTLNAVQLVKDLDQLKPSTATITSDEVANSIVMTDTQANIHHYMEIVSALDSVTSSSTTIRVIPLKFADAKTIASLIKDLFPSTTDANANGRGNRFRGFGGGGFGPFGGGGAPGGDSGSTEGNGKTPQIKVNAVSDDHSNSLIVTASDELMPTLTNLVAQVDVPVEDQTEVHVFHLRNADASEMADVLTSLFPDDSTSSSSDASRMPFRFGGFGPFGGGQQTSSSASPSDRAKKLTKVTAVADRRTQSLVVTTGKDLMAQIIPMVEELDSSRANRQTAHIIALHDADPADVQLILQDMFPSSTTSGSSRSGSSSSSTQNNNYLLNRAQTILQQQNSTTTSSFGSTGSSAGRGN